jgi:AcrR family transcriptional regulator
MLDAAGRVIARLGPGFTLADVAGEARIAAGTLIHRYGSKHGLLTAMIETAIASLRREMGSAGNAIDDPVEAVIQALVAWYAPLDDPVTAANNLAQLAFDLADDRLRVLMAEFYTVMKDELHPLLSQAIASGALPGAPPIPVMARILTAIADGTAIHWSARPEKRLRARLHADLAAVLYGWRYSPNLNEEERHL